MASTNNNANGDATYVPKSGLRAPYPAIEPYKTGTLKVDDLHEIYWEASGNPEGVPAVFLHGGPGGATSVSDRQWFDPKHYAIYLFDQRGCGKSVPHADLTNNTTWDIVKDIEKLREHFGHEKWHVFGGSWGSCLSLAYAQAHPDRVLSLTLRGIFTLRRSELEFFYQNGSSHIFPEQFEPYYEHIPEEEKSDLIAAYYKRLTSDDKEARLQAAKRWTRWEMSTLRLYSNEEVIKRADVDDYAVAFARIECHYFVNAGWMEDGQLLKKENVDKIRHIPATIIQGRYDVVCPAKTAYDLHKEWPQADYYLVPDAAHASGELGIAHQLITATDKYRSIKA
ncbi:putative proline iminopeptidase [Meira miltonrushii]|uniref:Proline iminopeptidase n=1 Tax=Meira miltonrushii TaxID=1280837 RepID=A0A316VGF9_9BASI|nr:putative proline iminopeptidase [Meira miltonrushii]PWN36672.1 putative proline iminopeptidase [Meira miltonrushii]